MRFLLLFIALSFYFPLDVFACSPYSGDVYERYEGNSLKYWTAGQVGLLTVMASSIGTAFESDKTNKTSAYVGVFGAYFVGCQGMVGHPEVQTKEWFDEREQTFAGKRKFVPKPTDPAQIEREKREFFREQARQDRKATLLSFIVNLANGISAKGDVNKALGFGGAAVNLGYYVLDLNDVRVGGPRVSAMVVPVGDGVRGVVAVGF